jgi:hypothetical protein
MGTQDSLRSSVLEKLCLLGVKTHRQNKPTYLEPSIIPALRNLRQEGGFKVSLGYILRLKTKQTKKLTKDMCSSRRMSRH